MNQPAAERAHAELQRLLAERQCPAYWIGHLEALLAEYRPPVNLFHVKLDNS